MSFKTAIAVTLSIVLTTAAGQSQSVQVAGTPTIAQVSAPAILGTSPGPAAASIPVPMKPELALKFKAAYYEKIAAQRTLDLLWDRFIQANPEAKKVQEDFQRADAVLNAVVPAVFKEQGDGVTIETYRIDPVGTSELPGPQFVPIEPAQEPKQAAK